MTWESINGHKLDDINDNSCRACNPDCKIESCEECLKEYYKHIEGSNR